MSSHYRNLIEAYARGPELLQSSIDGLSEELLDRAPVAGRWTTRQVVAHVADFEPIYADRMKRVIAEFEPTLFGGDPEQFAAQLAYSSRVVGDELALVSSVRRHVARILGSLSQQDFQRIGRHSEAGPISLEQLLVNITQHIPHHVRFIEEKRQALQV